jgi:hypothetical protein
MLFRLKYDHAMSCYLTCPRLYILYTFFLLNLSFPSLTSFSFSVYLSLPSLSIFSFSIYIFLIYLFISSFSIFLFLLYLYLPSLSNFTFSVGCSLCSPFATFNLFLLLYLYFFLLYIFPLSLSIVHLPFPPSSDAMFLASWIRIRIR